MIFLSLGTHEQPFERAARRVAELAREDRPVLIQHGATPPAEDLPHVRWTEYVGYDEMRELIEDSAAFVCHAGVGSVLTALTLGVTPIVMARRPDLAEHIDDHQLLFTQMLGQRELAIVPGDDEDLEGPLERVRALRGRPRGPGLALRAAVIAAAERRSRPRSG